MNTVIQDMGIVCALGQDKDEISRNLFAETPPSNPCFISLVSGRKVPVFSIHWELPPIDKAYFDTRTNRLLRVALDQLKPQLEILKSQWDCRRIGVILATNTSGIEEGLLAYSHHKDNGAWPEAFDYKQQEVSCVSDFAADYLGLEGPAYTVSTACSAGTKAIIAAHRLLSSGVCDAVVTGGADSLTQMTLNGFDALELVAQERTNPFSQNRAGLTLGEGAAAFILTRGNKGIRLLGYGESSDAYHMSAPHPDGKGASRAIREALTMASLPPESISYINLHGTGTKLNDAAECESIREVFGELSPLLGSTKPLTGHTLGVSGAIETAFLYLSLIHETNGSVPLPQHIFDGHTEPHMGHMNFVQNRQCASPIDGIYALMNNAFAFGGSNASLIIGKTVNE